jgi:predicted esterase
MKTIKTFVNDFYLELFLEENRHSNKLMVYLPGLPSIPKQQHFLKRIAKESCPSILLRYKGSWESRGVFLNNNFISDLVLLFQELKKGKFVDIFTNETLKINIEEILIVASSFGTFVGLEICKKLEFVKKLILFAPIFSLEEIKEKENLGYELKQFSEVYRTDFPNLNFLMNNKIIPNQLLDLRQLENKQLLLFHGEKDDLVPVKSALKAKNKLTENKINTELVVLECLKHSLINNLSENQFNKITEYINK